MRGRANINSGDVEGDGRNGMINQNMLREINRCCRRGRGSPKDDSNGHERDVSGKRRERERRDLYSHCRETGDRRVGEEVGSQTEWWDCEQRDTGRQIRKQTDRQK